MEFTKVFMGLTLLRRDTTFFSLYFVNVWQELIVVKSREIKRNNNIRYPSVQLYI